MKSRPLLLAAVVAAALAPAVHAWDHEGHRLVNGVALAVLPPEFPAFVREPANAGRIAFLAGEPDRWRNAPDLPLRQTNNTDHYLDLEDIPAAGLDVAKLPSFRYDFIVQFAAARAAHTAEFPPIDPQRNADHTSEWPGFVPWAVTEQFGRLRSSFSYLRVFEELGTPDEIANARANVIHTMGVLGHYVGDCAQPLHTTRHHHGWVGPNPHGYATWRDIHSWVDGGFIAKAGLTLAQLAPRAGPAKAIVLDRRADGRDPMFVAVVEYLVAQHRQVEPLYQLEKAGRLGRDDQPVTPEGRAFFGRQLVAGGEMLGSIWLTAWRTAVPDEYLRNALRARQAGILGRPPPAPARR